jgi:RNA polymerase sigma-70 factor (ECF subfamily)
MQGRGAPQRHDRPVVYCLVPRDLAPKLHEPLRRHFEADPLVEVVVERRNGDRRADGERRRAAAQRRGAERRAIRAATGRRVGERRAALVSADAPALPRKARAHVARLKFVERIPPSGQQAEDADTARLVMRFQAGDRDAFGELYMRYFARVYNYMRLVVSDACEAEDLTQEVFVKALAALPGYERREQPFRAWLFTLARNEGLKSVARRSRVDVTDALEIHARADEAARRDGALPDEPELFTLSWISDDELLMLVDRLPLAQRQVLALRYLLGLRPAEIATLIGSTPNHVSVLLYRALSFLRERLTALGRMPGDRRRAGTQRVFRKAVILRRRRFALLR